jgi:hypothetical protein
VKLKLRPTENGTPMNANRILLCVFIAISMSTRAVAEKFTLHVTTKTGNINNAGTNEQVFFALHYAEVVEIPPKKLGAKPKRKTEQKRIEFNLDNKGDDRKSGSVETYKFEVQCPIDGINGVEIGLKSGDDAWFLDGIRYHVEVNGTTSEATTIPFSGWLSAAANDGSKKAPAKQFYVFKVRPPTFPKAQAKK